MLAFPVSEAQTDDDGNYQIGWLQPGEYKVFFQGRPGEFLEEWFYNEPDLNLAASVFVYANQLNPGIDAQLAAYSTTTTIVPETTTTTVPETTTTTQPSTTTTTVPVDDPDSCGDALPLAFDTIHNGSIGPAGDGDYFKVEASATGYLSIVLMGGDGFVAQVKDSNCNDITTGQTEWGGVLLERRVLAGTYYIAVNHASPTGTGTYDLVASFQTQPKERINNILLMLDNSGSMNYPAYPDPYNPDVDGIDSGTVLTGATFAGSTTSYYGYFDPDARYSYSSNTFVRDEAGPWDGNFLNWVSMRRIDVFRKALMGGKRPCESCNGMAVLQGENPAQPSRYWQTYYKGADASPYGEAWYGVRDGYLYVKTTTDPVTKTIPGPAGSRFLIAVEKTAALEPEVFCEDGNPCGVLQKAESSARWGNIWFDVSGEGGRVWTPIRGSFSTMLLDIANIEADTSTPLAETLYTAIKYFQQDPSLPSSYVSCAGAGPWYPGGPNDPFYNFGELLPNAKSLVLMLTDGVTTMDQNIPELYRSYDGDTNATTRTYANSGSDYLDDVALYSHVNDLRADLDGAQTISASVVYAFGKDPMAKTLLMETAMNGGFKDANGNIQARRI